jgi:putative permease
MNIIQGWFRRHFADPQVVILAALLVVGTSLVLLVGPLLMPVLASIVIAYMLEVVVRVLERRKVPRLGAVLMVFLSFMAFLLILLFALLPKLSMQAAEVLTDLPATVNRAQEQLMQLPERYPDVISHEQLVDLVKGVQKSVGQLGQRLVSFSLASVRGVITFLVYMVLMPLMVFFFLKDKHRLMSWIAQFLPENRSLSQRIWCEVDQQIGNYMRGKFWEILIIWGASWATFYFMNLKFALLMGLLSGISVIVPYVGVTVTAIPIGLAGFLQWGLGSELLYLMIGYGVIQMLDGNLLAPLLLSGVVDIHPLAIICAVLFFGGVWGFWGVFFAIPLATLVQAILRAWPRHPADEVTDSTPQI